MSESDPMPCRFCGFAPKRESDWWMCIHCDVQGPINDYDHIGWDAMMRGGPALADDDCIEVRGFAVVGLHDAGIYPADEEQDARADADAMAGGTLYPIRVRLPKPKPQPVIDAEVLPESEA